ncbi:MAG: hypothetical protein ACPG7F_07355 [Aggregatilineales bacterium]
MSEKHPPQSNTADDFADPKAALYRIRLRMQQITQDYASGDLNKAQFNAMYRHYVEKRSIIERILERNPQSDAWKHVASPGMTGQLKENLEARPLYYMVFRRGEEKPLFARGRLPREAARQIHRVLQVVWKLKTWRSGLARKSLGNSLWLLLVMGTDSFTMVLYHLQPSSLQSNNIRDLHADFERANKFALQRNYPVDRMVFPQRALLENEPD